MDVNISGQSIVERGELCVCVPTLDANAPVMVIHGHGLVRQSFHDPLRSIAPDAAVGRQ